MGRRCRCAGAGRPRATGQRARARRDQPPRGLPADGRRRGGGPRAAQRRVLPQGPRRRLPQLVQRQPVPGRRRGAAHRTSGAGRRHSPGHRQRPRIAGRERPGADVAVARHKPSAPATPDPPAARGRGGFFAGFFIGVLFGIGSALAVAVWLNVRGSPFSEREVPVELPPLKTPPAAPVTGPGDAGALPDDGLDIGTPDQGVAPAPADLSRPDAGELRPERSAAADGSAPRISLPFGYYLQAGAFRNPVEAEDRKARLNLLGQTATVQPLPGGSGLLYRIRVGPFATQAELERAREFLKRNGIDSIPMRPEAANPP
ncbi:MAG: hypothetical protein FGM40_02380 [Rhodocyclaceae bacterium]|nr:hypothetical protein [Rhodocyclaceae bacterium]